MFNFYGGPMGGHFEATYRAFPLAFIDKQSAEYGDKVILPPSALDRLGAAALAGVQRAHTDAWRRCFIHAPRAQPARRPQNPAFHHRAQRPPIPRSLAAH